MLLKTQDYWTDGTLEAVSAYTYDADGRMLTARHTNPSAVDPDNYVAETWTYDADGNNVWYAWEAHEMVGSTQETRYDAEGRVVERIYDRDPQGSIDDTHTLTYDCP